jgi:hypothetical protein
MHSLTPMTETTTTVTAIDETIRISVSGEIASTPEQVVAATVDFSERRERIFPAVSMSRMTLHSLGATTADATEGTRAGPFVFWERCTYDWSQPGQVTAIVTDSNIYAFPGSVWQLTATSTAAGSRVVMTWTRRFQKRPLGWFMGFVYRHDGKRAFTKYAREILSNLVLDDTNALQ